MELPRRPTLLVHDSGVVSIPGSSWSAIFFRGHGPALLPLRKFDAGPIEDALRGVPRAHTGRRDRSLGKRIPTMPRASQRQAQSGSPGAQPHAPPSLRVWIYEAPASPIEAFRAIGDGGSAADEVDSGASAIPLNSRLPSVAGAIFRSHATRSTPNFTAKTTTIAFENSQRMIEIYAIRGVMLSSFSVRRWNAPVYARCHGRRIGKRLRPPTTRDTTARP
jgi:hypothetical protein